MRPGEIPCHKAPAHPLSINRTDACITVKNKKQEIIAGWVSKAFWENRRYPRQAPTFITGAFTAGGIRGFSYDHAQFASRPTWGRHAARIHTDDRSAAGAAGMNRRNHRSCRGPLCLHLAGGVSRRSCLNPTCVQHRQQCKVQPCNHPAGQSECHIPGHGRTDRRQTDPVKRPRRRTDRRTIRHDHPALPDVGSVGFAAPCGAAVEPAGIVLCPGLPWIPPWVPVPKPPCRYPVYTCLYPLLSR